MNKIFVILIFSIFLSNCSLNENSRIWNKKEKIENENKVLKKIFTEKEVISTEFNPLLKLDLSKIRQNNKIFDPLNNFGSSKYNGQINKINSLFDILINKTSLDSEIKYLIIYKKALYNADTINEGQILEILNPIINSKSVWKSHALYLIAEYFYSKGEKQKSKEFFSQIITLENANLDILKETQKRLNRDLSE